MKQRNLDHYPEILEDLWAKMAELLADKGLDRAVADEAAFAVTEYIRKEWSGRNRYTPKGKKPAEPAEPGMFDTLGDEGATPEHLRQLRGQVMLILNRLGVGCVYSSYVVDLVRDIWKGAKIYIPKGVKFDCSRRDYEIWREFRGAANVDQLMAKHGLTMQRLYQINKRYQKREDKRTQPELPGVAKVG